MYKQIKKIEKVSFNNTENRLYLYLRDENKLAEIDNLGNIKEEVTFFDIKQIYRFNVTNENFIASFNNEKTIFYSDKGEELLTFARQLYFTFLEENDIYIYIKNKSFLYRFDKKNYKIEVFSILEEPLFSCLYNDFLILKKEGILYIYIDKKSNISLLWQKDISEITQYTEWDNSEVKGEIREIYSYKDSIIVLTQVFVLRINLHTGEIIYSLRLPAGLMTLSIENQKAYGCYGYHYMEINLEKGTLINFIRIEEAIYEGKSYNATMNKATFHNGYVFHGLRLEGGQYAVGTINTQTSKREWVSLLKTNMVEKIQFHQDKMFIADSGGNLFIYEKI